MLLPLPNNHTLWPQVRQRSIHIPGLVCVSQTTQYWKLTLSSIFTFFGIFLEAAAVWAYSREDHILPIRRDSAMPIREKYPRATLDAPVEPIPPISPVPAPAGTV